MSSLAKFKINLSNLLKSETEANLILFSLVQKRFPIKNFRDLDQISLELDETFVLEAKKIADERLKGTPLQHLLKAQYFLNHEYSVSKDVLIPRPETEVLVSTIMKLENNPKKFAELGLGSGVISCELIHHFKSISALASETSLGAIKTAEQNFNSILGSEWSSKIKIIKTIPEQGFEVFLPESKFDFVVSNPPYVSHTDEVEEQVINHEPHAALFPPVHVNYFYENFLQHAQDLLKLNGRAYFEVPHERAHEILALYQSKNHLRSELMDDLTGRPRILITQLIK